MKQIKVGYVGLGARGMMMLRNILDLFPNVEIVGVCDLFPDRVETAQKMVEEKKGCKPVGSVDYNEIVALDADAIMVMSAWESHVDICTAAMYAGKKVATEVFGAYSLEQCYRLVRAYRETGIHCMMLENCCYGRREQTVLKMVREGLFGEVVHCGGGYMHYLASEITYGGLNQKHYRLRNYIGRNCENYPTHEIGPIAKVLNINRGNRFLTLTSTASKTVGVPAYIKEHIDDLKVLENQHFNQGDVVTTVIKCANGETVTITLDTTLPRAYSRAFSVRGTKASYNEDTASFYFPKEHESIEGNPKKLLNNEDTYLDRYQPEIWKKYNDIAMKTGHDGMDFMVLSAFFESVEKDATPPIDTYDTATWMSISALSEESIAKGSAPVFFPDFTEGKWLLYKPEENKLEFSLD